VIGAIYPRIKEACEGQMKSILDRSFKYTPSSKTDLRKTFAEVRREQRLNAKPTTGQQSIGANIFTLMTQMNSQQRRDA
jgi:hypothetical protein